MSTSRRLPRRLCIVHLATNTLQRSLPSPYRRRSVRIQLPAEGSTGAPEINLNYLASSKDYMVPSLDQPTVYTFDMNICTETKRSEKNCPEGTMVCELLSGEWMVCNCAAPARRCVRPCGEYTSLCARFYVVRIVTYVRVCVCVRVRMCVCMSRDLSGVGDCG